MRTVDDICNLKYNLLIRAEKPRTRGSFTDAQEAEKMSLVKNLFRHILYHPHLIHILIIHHQCITTTHITKLDLNITAVHVRKIITAGK